MSKEKKPTPPLSGAGSLAPVSTTVKCPLQCFNEKQKKEIRKTLEAQKKMLKAKKTELEAWDDIGKAKLKLAFGTDDESARKLMQERVDRMLKLNEAMMTDNFRMSSLTPEELASRNIKKEDLFAYVVPGDKNHTVNLGDKFWNSPLEGQDSRAGTLAHEMSHFNDIGGTKDGFPDIRTGDGIYGLHDSHALAALDSSKALKHADSFEYWLEDAK